MWPTKSSILVALALLIAAPLTSAGAQETTGSLPLECAARDLQLVAQLEQANVNSRIFDEAFSTIMRARRACYEARVTEGLALYDSIHTPSPGQARAIALAVRRR
jgi:hypothetical protein